MKTKDLPLLTSPLHGGALNQAINKYKNDKNPVPEKQWLDLSTGINPNGWSVPTIPASVYNRLPENDDGLIEAAQAYYQVSDILPVAGSQEAIQLLPEIFQRYGLLSENPRIGIISPCYAEHEFQWQKHQFTIIHLSSDSVDEMIDTLDVLVLINPNNPTGELIDKAVIKQWQVRLADHQAYLIIDEAFMDSTPQKSVLSVPDYEHRIVLRSVGKFFGLAGVRCGFVVATQKILSLLKYHQGPWSVSGPTRWVVTKALRDKAWIDDNKKYLQSASVRLENLLQHYLMHEHPQRLLAGTLLFKTLFLENAECLYEQLEKRGVLVRLLDNKKGLRFGSRGVTVLSAKTGKRSC
ncbi:MAG: aminotransferase class I/II-fold pyridoxal phosphate-dependent enzyme, partial [gamma proteobacterium symbiont of Bathyaustriella thionipta]|nr:aminotransferase class I/II-fold pyridoxal phosphate-dependent enzyme [gamma proteobacterium symbiont of Bathyaustriella thionipta]